MGAWLSGLVFALVSALISVKVAILHRQQKLKAKNLLIKILHSVRFWIAKILAVEKSNPWRSASVEVSAAVSGVPC
jgi:hypothetical protein